MSPRKAAKPDTLSEYRARRHFDATPEPDADGAAPPPAPDALRFVVQEHHATRLHWDLRLEHDGALASWAIPNGIPDDPRENRKAVHTEDHPLEYLDFSGEIPKGNYGAGTMRIWDRGTYELHSWAPRKVVVSFHGERLQGRYALFQTGADRDWMIHRMDPPVDPAREPLPEGLVPMLASPGRLPANEAAYAFEIKWDGVRALAYSEPGRLRLESRRGNEILRQYPEIRGLNRALGSRSAVLDGEIVAFDEAGQPSFQLLQGRMHLTSDSVVRRRAEEAPIVYLIFDVLYLDGHSQLDRPYTERRALLEELALDGPAWRTPPAHVGEGSALLEATASQGLEGVIAKRLDSRYEPGRRGGAWLKIKNSSRQELVIGGWVPGRGRRRERIGALLLGYYEDAEEQTPLFRFAGKVGTGFDEAELDRLGRLLRPLERETSPFVGRRPQRDSVFVEPRLVAEIEFTQWTDDGLLRHPSYKGLREDKDAREVVRESPDFGPPTEAPEGPPGGASLASRVDAGERARDGSVTVTVEGRRLKLTNLDKVLYPEAGFTKGDVLDYYARIAPVVLPHLRDRPLTLKRYPNGVEGKFFYEKNCPKHRPDWVQTASIWSRHRKDVIDFCLFQDLPTLLWAANLADLELHAPMALGSAIDRPTAMVFDLDPGPPADIVQCCDVALLLRGMFERLGLQSFAKTSGSKGLQLYVPLNGDATYDDTKSFARTVAELLERTQPELVVSRMTKEIRGGKVLVDWSQNDEHKTTVAVYSLRARPRPTVSTPVTWEEVERAHDARDATLLTFDHAEVLARIERDGDLFAPVLTLRQTLPRLA